MKTVSITLVLICWGLTGVANGSQPSGFDAAWAAVDSLIEIQQYESAHGRVETVLE